VTFRLCADAAAAAAAADDDDDDALLHCIIHLRRYAAASEMTRSLISVVAQTRTTPGLLWWGSIGRDA